MAYPGFPLRGDANLMEGANSQCAYISKKLHVKMKEFGPLRVMQADCPPPWIHQLNYILHTFARMFSLHVIYQQEYPTIDCFGSVPNMYSHTRVKLFGSKIDETYATIPVSGMF